MSVSEVYNILNSITAFKDKVAYRAFPVGKAPKLPFICIMSTQTNNFKADNKVYHVIRDMDIELYSKDKDEVSEGLIEKALNDNNIVWEKYEEWIDDEEVYQITYEIEV